ncbi:TetR/AcrR family transcriptional regulator [Staphylococcus sp. GSSP0090]|nr:TetR/AcrR family transcriptional regulator [Staphylococcus sp. GSSP0090]
MRLQDDNKRTQIYDATAQLINELGFVNVSMSKIAKEAGISKANLYTYFNNKEDMFAETYIYFKKQMLSHCLEHIDDTASIQSSVMQFCSNLLDFIREDEVRFLFIEQCNSAPQLQNIEDETITELMTKNCALFQQGIDEKILKDVPPLLLISFCVYAITQIYREYNQDHSYLSEINFDDVFQMSWDAIKR